MNAEKNDINKRENKGEVFIRKWLEFSPMIIIMLCLSFIFVIYVSYEYEYESIKNITFKEISMVSLEIFAGILVVIVGPRIIILFLMAFFCKLNFILFMKSLLLESLFYYLTFFILRIIVTFLNIEEYLSFISTFILTFISIYIFVYLNIYIIKNYKFIKKQ